MKIIHTDYNKLISLNNILKAWVFFQSGKAGRKEVVIFKHSLEDNLFQLQKELRNFLYQHGKYEKFLIHDPKTRLIHKACVRDRIVHVLVAKELERIYQNFFIRQSYSCQKGKGINLALQDIIKVGRRLSRNNIDNFYYIKIDIKKFFNNIDHKILVKIIKRKIENKDFLWLLNRIITSYKVEKEKGLPLGNFTSQWLANIYLNELDYFAKHILGIKYYFRYADDILLMSDKQIELINIVKAIKKYLKEVLKLDIHKSVKVSKYSQGIDMVGYKVFPKYILPRKRIRGRAFINCKKASQLYMEKKMGYHEYCSIINSYLGWFKYANAYKLSNQIIYN